MTHTTKKIEVINMSKKPDTMETEEATKIQQEDETVANASVQQKYKFASDIVNGELIQTIVCCDVYVLTLAVLIKKLLHC